MPQSTTRLAPLPGENFTPDTDPAYFFRLALFPQAFIHSRRNRTALEKALGIQKVRPAPAYPFSLSP
ncbi:hypothetical protein J2Z49_002733 [Desulfofundulus luciae]|uniref:Uncharacterized protein n=1 Tax=Desulfofundulus luciae TaxID=74702 RepID=A0ABU0B861_9FIRM|nr:hypothetical protein [Desulfofundulus luciae]MDQ0287603.1 hypothetical protein [Desulfofundulus luciae]